LKWESWREKQHNPAAKKYIDYSKLVIVKAGDFVKVKKAIALQGSGKKKKL
jgi:hypothetical protein